MTETKQTGAAAATAKAADVDDDVVDRNVQDVKFEHRPEEYNALLDRLSETCPQRFMSAFALQDLLNAHNKFGFHQVYVKYFFGFSTAESSADKAVGTGKGMPCTADRRTQSVPCLYTQYMAKTGNKKQDNLIEKLAGKEYEDDLFKFIEHSEPQKLTGRKAGRKQSESDIRKGVLYGGIDGIPLYIMVTESSTHKHMLLVRIYKKAGVIRTFNLYRGCAHCQSMVACPQYDAVKEAKTDKTASAEAYGKLTISCPGCKITQYCSESHRTKHIAFHSKQCDRLHALMDKEAERKGEVKSV